MVVTLVIVGVISYICFIVWEMMNAPTVDDDDGLTKTDSDI